MWIEELKSGSDEDRERAAYRLFLENPQAAAGDSEAAQSLIQLLEHGTESPGAILLASAASDERTLELLRGLRAKNGDAPAKLHNWSPVTPLYWPIDVSLSRLGDSEARNRLLGGIASADTAARLFLLEALPAIDDPSVIQQFRLYLEDETQINEGVPSGAGPRRRVKDKAVDALAKRLNMKPSFELNGAAQYTEQQIAEIRKLIRGSIPS